MSTTIRTGKLQEWQRQHVQRMYEAYELSPRQREVCDQLLLGKRSGEIADALYIERSTAKNHLCDVNRRLGTHSAHELILVLLGVIVPDVVDEQEAA